MKMAGRVKEIKKIAQKRGLEGIHNPYLNMSLLERANELKQFLVTMERLNYDLSALNKMIQSVQSLNRDANPQFTETAMKTLHEDILRIKQAAGALK